MFGIWENTVKLTYSVHSYNVPCKKVLVDNKKDESKLLLSGLKLILTWENVCHTIVDMDNHLTTNISTEKPLQEILGWLCPKINSCYKLFAQSRHIFFIFFSLSNI